MKIFALSAYLVVFLKMGCESSHKPLPGGLDQLAKGKVAFQIPVTMNLDSSYRGVVSITKAQNDSILFAGLDSSGFKKDTLKISSRIRVSLIDPSGDKNFKIVPLNTEEQIVDDSSNTVWQWNVSPLRGGNSELILRVTAKVINRFGEDYRDIQVYDKSIQIKSSFFRTCKQFWLDYWQWIIVVILIPVGKWLYNKWAGRKRMPAP